jgi:hypothetical protein
MSHFVQDRWGQLDRSFLKFCHLLLTHRAVIPLERSTRQVYLNRNITSMLHWGSAPRDSHIASLQPGADLRSQDKETSAAHNITRDVY